MRPDAVDLDDERTWPKRLLKAVERYVESSGADAWDDRDLPDLFGGHPLVAYHATRLLPREADSVRRDGLVPLSADHVLERLMSAEREGVIDRAQRINLLERQVFSATSAVNYQTAGRAGQVCAVVGRKSLNAHGVGSLLSLWGGEAIYWAAEDEVPTLRVIGTPSIVVLHLDLRSRRVRTAGPIFAQLAARWNGEPHVEGEVHVRGPVPSEEVVTIWQPGTAEYEGLPGLPGA